MVDKANYMQSAKSLEDLTKIVFHLAEAVYYVSLIENWTLLQNVLKTFYNLISYC